jgi:hypothetical protein
MTTDVPRGAGRLPAPGEAISAFRRLPTRVPED